MPDTDPVATYLAEVRERNERYIKAMRFTEWTVQQEPCGEVRRLLAVLDAVLALADDLDAELQVSWGSTDRAYVGQKLREVISAALLGEEATSGP